ncbi:hypothetical protein HU200_014532 [Digitaria exilis]|uniref:Bifunctional inhibitor/plant lipid transfer protein/seed storage helical domain-containing protein n=1 Tax=Digitaria exilis TaxID=1010633 RepID=A0A835FC06_9POAL|nr:hypothetical protein HU200_014532 [Digitaria exilis]
MHHIHSPLYKYLTFPTPTSALLLQSPNKDKNSSSSYYFTTKRVSKEMAPRSSTALPALLLAATLLFSSVAVVRGQQRGNPCPTNALADLKVCADVLVLLKLKINVPQSQQCCPLLGNLVNLDVAACLCAAIRLSVLGIPVNLPLDVPLVLNYCGRNASAVPGSNCS